MTARLQSPQVLVVVGTDYHPFDRLIRWVDAWLEGRTEPVTCLVQHGRAGSPRVAEGAPFLDHDQLQTLMDGAEVVVSHGGPNTIAEARKRGHHPLVVPRDPRHGEHVDGHQIRFARRLAEDSLIEVADSAAQLAAALDARLDGSWVAPEITAGADPVASARRFGDLVDDLVSRRPLPSRSALR